MIDKRDEINIIRTAVLEAKEEGREEGKMTIAAKLLKEGLSDELIIKTCDITAQQLEELKK